MLKILGVVILGGVIGYILRDKIKGAIISKIIMTIIYMLLLILGIAVGANQTIIDNLSTIGVKALVLSSAAILGSVIMAKILYHKMYKNNKEKEDTK